MEEEEEPNNAKMKIEKPKFNSRIWLGVAFALCGVGIVVIIIGLTAFNIQEDLSWTAVNAAKVGQLGDFVGGLAGSLWSLAGVIFFYVALKEQRKDFETNQKNLDLQNQTLQQQIEEFKLQKKELEETRMVFEEQTKTQQMQRFENTFFNLIAMNHQIVNGLRINDQNYGRKVFGYFEQRLISVIGPALNAYNFNISNDRDNFSDLEKEANKGYLKLYNEEIIHYLSHYFINLMVTIDYIISSDFLSKHEKARYLYILRAQLSSAEMSTFFVHVNYFPSVHITIGQTLHYYNFFTGLRILDDYPMLLRSFSSRLQDRRTFPEDAV